METGVDLVDVLDRVDVVDRRASGANALVPLSRQAEKSPLGCRLIAARQTAHGRGRLGRD